MNIIISEKTSRNRRKKWYYLEWGKGPGERIATGIFTYTKPVSQAEKNHNKEALLIVENKRSQMLLDAQAMGSSYIPRHKLQFNFLDYYARFVKEHSRKGNRHLAVSLTAFQSFIGSNYISAIDITENLCLQPGFDVGLVHNKKRRYLEPKANQSCCHNRLTPALHW